MRGQPSDFNAFWLHLEGLLTNAPSTETVFNQYRDFNPDVDVPSAASIRVANLRSYLERACATASYLIVGEAAGPWGCRFSGIPFVGERQLLDPSFPIQGERSSRTNPNRATKVSPPFISKSATAFWEVLLPYNSHFVVWDAFPFHPHEPGDVLTVRNPTKKEVSDYSEALRLIKDYIQPDPIIAVGKKAEDQLKALNLSCNRVRHPSRGGKKEFTFGVEKLFNDQMRSTC
jgi:hypothetical protein